MGYESNPKPICIVGTTASGKTELSLKLAESFIKEHKKVALISLDAFQIYKGMDIGTGKIDLRKYSHIPHFGIDIITPDTNYSVAHFLEYVNSVKKELDSNTQVIYVGGTGLYVRAIVDGFEFPPEDLGLRKELEQKYQNKTDKAYKKLIELDSKAAEKIDSNNFRRTIRALEVIEISHKKFSDYRTTYDEVNESADFFGLYQTRLQGRESITQRVNTMFSEGWIDEVQSLLTEGISVTASKAIGYKQILEAISVNSFTNLEEIVTNKTVKFSRRQRMWFKRDSRIKWMFGDYKHNLDRVTEYIKEEIQC